MTGLNRSSYYYHPSGVSEEELALMSLIDRIYTDYPFYGVRKITAELRRRSYWYNHKRVYRLMRLMGLEAIRPGRNTSKTDKNHKVFPYLLRGRKPKACNEIWSSDITYIPIRGGFAYLVAVIDWFSRYVLSWELSNTLDVYFCLEALDLALKQGKPVIFNTDQGSQFTSNGFTDMVINNQILMSMDSKGRALDNIFIERFWRSLKYEDIYIRDYSTISELREGMKNYFYFYNYLRPHQSLNYAVPAEIYYN